MIIEQRRLEHSDDNVMRRIDPEDRSEPISGVYVVLPDGSELQLSAANGGIEISGKTVGTMQLAIIPKTSNVVYVLPTRYENGKPYVPNA